MACLRKLKEDISVLESVFPKNHERVQVLVASVDEISLKFVGAAGDSIIINANIQENYPRQPPIWFSESDDQPAIGAALERLTEQTEPTSILVQIHSLISELCRHFGVAAPTELQRLTPQDEDEGQGSASDMETDPDPEEEDEEEEEDDVDDDFNDVDMVEMAEEDPKESGDDELTPEGKQVLEKISRINRDQHLKGQVTSSVTAMDRIMKEARACYKSDHYKAGSYTIDFNESNLYEWNIKLYKVDPDSQLAKDLIQLATEKKDNFIRFQFVFNDNFPCEPPFVRLVSPPIQNGFVLNGGAICMELLTKQGWSSAYSIESLILQIAATLVKGKAFVQFDTKLQNQYTLARAQASFRSLVQIHQKSGWFTPPKSDG